MNKTKLLISASTYPRWSGDSTPGFVKQFAEELVQAGDSVYVLAPHSKDAKTSESELGVAVHRYRYFLPASGETVAYEGGAVNKIKKTPIYALKVLLLVAALFFSSLWKVFIKRIDVLNPHWAIPQGFVAVVVKFITGKKVVLTVHGGDIFNLNGKIMTIIKRFVLKHSDMVCPNSNATMEACREIYDREYTIIPMGIYMDRFVEKLPSKSIQDRHNLNSFTILFVGRLAEVKGVEYLLDAVRKLKQEKQEFKLLIVGDGPLKQSFESYVEQHQLSEFVELVGWVPSDQLNDYYSVADVFVGPSLSEPQGLVFCEALATGTPVIATNVGGLPDIVQEGKTGYLISPKSSDAIKSKLLYLITHRDELKKMSNRARASVYDRFSWQSTTSRYREIFSSIIN